MRSRSERRAPLAALEHLGLLLQHQDRRPPDRADVDRLIGRVEDEHPGARPEPLPRPSRPLCAGARLRGPRSCDRGATLSHLARDSRGSHPGRRLDRSRGPAPNQPLPRSPSIASATAGSAIDPSRSTEEHVAAEPALAQRPRLDPRQVDRRGSENSSSASTSAPGWSSPSSEKTRLVFHGPSPAGLGPRRRDPDEAGDVVGLVLDPFAQDDAAVELAPPTAAERRPGRVGLADEREPPRRCCRPPAARPRRGSRAGTARTGPAAAGWESTTSISSSASVRAARSGWG